jgi:hypothetical protein
LNAVFPGLTMWATFSTLNVGLAGTGNRTRATCVASSGTNRSAIHYASPSDTILRQRMKGFPFSRFHMKMKGNFWT